LSVFSFFFFFSSSAYHPERKKGAKVVLKDVIFAGWILAVLSFPPRLQETPFLMVGTLICPGMKWI